MEDFKGLKFRVGGFAGTIIAKVGGVPQQIAGGDIYPALEKGTIDAAEWVGPYDDEKLGFVKVAKYYYYPGWWEGTGQGHNIMNMEKWNALPKHYQAAIETASRDTFTWVTGKYDYVNPPALKRLLVAGAILKPFPQEVLEACYKAANEIYADLSKTNPHFGKMYASLSAFRSESLAWMQVAELELRQLHDADAHPHLTARATSKQRKPRRILRGFFFDRIELIASPRRRRALRRACRNIWSTRSILPLFSIAGAGDFSASLRSASASFLSLADIFLSAWTCGDLRLDDGFGADIFLGRGIEAAEHQADVVDDVVVVVIAGKAVLLGDAVELRVDLRIRLGVRPEACR